MSLIFLCVPSLGPAGVSMISLCVSCLGPVGVLLMSVCLMFGTKRCVTDLSFF